jgi:putative oxygen-independent coproporphyrinogen III oxidase
MPSAALPPLSLYVHIPWCVRKCPYCDFNSHAAPAALPEADYLNSLLADLERDARWAQGRPLHSVFFGGGTPSLFSGRGIGTLLRAAAELIGLPGEAEVTLEANPGTVEQQRFADFREAGVNRLSIGIQSLHDTHLKTLGRIHSRAEALRAVQAARSAGFDNINVDLMHGLPQQSVSEALADLEQVIALEPAHISWYQLTIERNTAFYNKPPLLPGADVLADIEDRGRELLQKAGYAQYEISAYSKAGKQSRHNRNYWEFGDYLGVGAGAHGKITDSVEHIVRRSRKTRLPTHYMANKPASNPWSAVIGEDLPLEFMMNCLRLDAGVPSVWYEARTGLTLAALEPDLICLRDRQLLEPDPERLATTALGRRFLNDVLAVFMPERRQSSR